MALTVLTVLATLAACGGADESDGSEATVAAVTTVASAPSGTGAVEPTDSTAGGVQPAGFELVAAEATAADGEVCPLCLWVADTPEQRSRGLMGVTDLGPADGMLFRYAEPSTGRFWMSGTPMPLSIAFFADGGFVSAVDMIPCLGDPPSGCVYYGADGPFSAAVEVAAGQLDELGIAEGSRLVVLDTPCPPQG